MSAVAQRYARAILSLAIDEKVVREVATDLESLAKMIALSPELGSLLGNPMLPAAERGAVVLAIAEKVGAHKVTRNSLRLLADKGRLAYLPDLAVAFQDLADDTLGRARAELRATAPLSAEALEQIRKALSARTGKDVMVKTQIDPELLGGVVASVGDTVFDSSVRSRLERLRQHIIEA